MSAIKIPQKLAQKGMFVSYVTHLQGPDKKRTCVYVWSRAFVTIQCQITGAIGGTLHKASLRGFLALYIYTYRYNVIQDDQHTSGFGLHPDNWINA